MRQPLVLCTSLLAFLAFASSASAVTLYAGPDGTATSGCYYDIPCSLDGATKAALPGDTVVLKDGIYKQGIYPPANTQPSPPQYITFQADECALPIIEGAGVDPLADDQASGMYAETATYLRFVGLVMRGWSSGFSNKFQDTDQSTPPTSNGHFEYKNCIADGNGRTGFTMFSAEGLHIQNCISAHNGSSIMHSWSSGITLLEVQGTGNLIEGNISFENMDNHDVAQAPDSPGKHSDGNGFIVDENSNGVTFINNLAFANGGSCLRLTRSSNATFINNTCYHNAQDTRDTGPTNPGEVYFTQPSSGQTDPRTGVNFMNNVFWATGTGPGAQAIQNKPTSGWAATNLEGKNATTLFTAPDGMNPDFTLAAAATTAIGKGGTDAAVPMNDIGFNPKCIVKKAPTPVGMMVNGSWWQYSIDYDYIKSIGGVAKCFSPATRSGTPDIGAYKNGAVTANPVATCTPTIPADHAGPPMTGAGGAGTASGGGSSTAGAGGATAAGGGASSQGGNSASSAGSSSTVTGGGTAVGSGGGAVATAGGSSVGGPGNQPAAPASTDAGCGCRVGSQPTRSSLLIGFGAFALSLLSLRRRRAARS